MNRRPSGWREPQASRLWSCGAAHIGSDVHDGRTEGVGPSRPWSGTHTHVFSRAGYVPDSLGGRPASLRRPSIPSRPRTVSVRSQSCRRILRACPGSPTARRADRRPGVALGPPQDMAGVMTAFRRAHRTPRRAPMPTWWLAGPAATGSRTTAEGVGVLESARSLAIASFRASKPTHLSTSDGRP